MSQQTAGHLIDPLSVENQSDLNVRMANLKLPDNFSRDADRLGPRHMAVAGEDQWNCHSPAIVEQSFLQRPAVAFLQEHSLPLDPAIPASASHMENDFGRKSAGGRDHSVADSASPNLPAGLFQLLRIRCGKDCAAYSGTGGEIGNGGTGLFNSCKNLPKRITGKYECRFLVRHRALRRIRLQIF